MRKTINIGILLVLISVAAFVVVELIQARRVQRRCNNFSAINGNAVPELDSLTIYSAVDAETVLPLTGFSCEQAAIETALLKKGKIVSIDGKMSRRDADLLRKIYPTYDANNQPFVKEWLNIIANA